MTYVTGGGVGNTVGLLSRRSEWRTLAYERDSMMISEGSAKTGEEGPLPASHGEEELRARLAAVVESSDDAIVSKSLDGIIRTWNKGAERMFGYRAEDAIGKHITLIIPPDRHREEEVILKRLKRGEHIDHFETVRVRRDGALVNISLSISPIRDSAGQLIGASKIARDISLRKRIEGILQDESRILELLNRTGNLIASQLELDALVKQVLEAAIQLAGATHGAFVHTRASVEDEMQVSFNASSEEAQNLFDGLGITKRANALLDLFQNQEVVRVDDIESTHSLGLTMRQLVSSDFPVRSYMAASVISRSREIIGGLILIHPEPGVFSDRTERIIRGVAAQAAIAIDNATLFEDVKQAAREREQLLQAERAARAEAERASLMKDEFLAMLSHELRTPLTAILGWSQILRSKSLTPEEFDEGLGVIERNTRIQTQLIEELLDMSRIVSGKVRLGVEQVDLKDVMTAAVGSVRLSADAKDIRLNLIADPSVEPILGDPGRLQQCLWNLLSNAIKFTPRGGLVEIILKKAGDNVEIAVRDNGKGINPEFLPQLFQRFKQADSSSSRQHGGLGLGLSIVKHLIELHGGRVSGHSEGEGNGSTFRILLPVRTSHMGKQQETEDSRPNENRSTQVSRFNAGDFPTLQGIKVLAIDDEPDSRKLVQRILEDCGAEVLVASSAKEGLELVKQERPHMIISDIGMPLEDGYEFARRLRNLSAADGGDTPAAALTAFARAEDRMRALRAGFQTHVSKPVEATELAAVVASLAVKS